MSIDKVRPIPVGVTSQDLDFVPTEVLMSQLIDRLGHNHHWILVEHQPDSQIRIRGNSPALNDVVNTLKIAACVLEKEIL